jgi:hypothetical protein
MGTRSFPGVKWPGRGVDYQPPPSVVVKEQVELYICSFSGPSWPVLGWTLLLPLFWMCVFNLRYPACSGHEPCETYTILFTVVFMAIQYFSTLISGTNFGWKKWLNIKCVLIFSTNLSQTFLIVTVIKRHIIINVHRYSCKVPVIFFRFWWNLNILGRFSKNT